MGYRVSVDVGGTFTDVGLYDEQDKKIWITKVPSTPKDQSVGVENGIKKIVQRLGIRYEDISYLIHGTTVATNALLERKGAKTALITTEGFRDIFEIGNQTRPNLYNFWTKRPKPPIPRYLIFELPERVLYNGEVVKKLDENEAKRVTEKLKQEKIESIAVCFLHSYINPVNEKRLKEIILEEIPEVYVSLSCETLPEIKEYERTCTTAVNAYLIPKVEYYIRNLVRRKNELNILPLLHVMQSNGGIMSAESAAERSVHTVFSGLAGGALAGKFISKLTGNENIITLDMGGTSADICLIEKGKIRLTTEGKIGTFPIKVPMVEMHTIGAGGGSIAWIDNGGILRVGPKSAGADPGPVCYNMGGTKPTVTDANLTLGYINPKYFLGGEMSLSLNQAILSIKRELSSLGLQDEQLADGILRVVNSNMIKGINVVSTQRGYDPREFTLVVFGGAGPLHGVMLSSELKMKKVIVPISPGNFSAIGVQLANIRYDYVRTRVRSTKEFSVSEYNELYVKMRQEAMSDLAKESITKDKIIFEGSADMRYAGQTWELSVPVPIELSSKDDIQKIAQNFHEVHKQTYGYSMEDENVVFVNLRLSSIGEIPPLKVSKETTKGKNAQKAFKGKRKAYFEEKSIECSIYERKKLNPCNIIEGPAIIEEYASTTVIPPGEIARIDEFRNIIIGGI
jgi:N-methylhydantoinase A